MLGRLFIGSIILVCCGCSTATMQTEVASTKWRMENLEQRFLDFREQAALREAGLSTRITKLEKELGLPVPSQEEMIVGSTQLTPDVHVFVAPSTAKTTKEGGVDNGSIPAPSESVKQPVVEDSADTTAESASAQKQSEKDAALVVPLPKDSAKPSILTPVEPSATPSTQPSGLATAQPTPTTSPKASATPEGLLPSSAPHVAPQASAETIAKRPVRPPVKKTGSTSMYKHGLQLLEKGRNAEGRERLEEFLTEFPNDPLVPNAVYWVGESYYSQKDYLLAVDLFREVLRRFPESSKAKSAMLKIGYSYKRLDELSEARRYLLKVVEKYPKSNEARLARKMLSGI